MKPTAKTPLSERRHCDPPALWTTVILSSLVLHLFGFGMLRLWLTLRLSSFQSARELIPIDVVAVASEAASPTQTITSIRNPTSGNTPTKALNPLPNRQSTATLTRTNTPQIPTPQNTQNSSRSSQGLPKENKNTPATNSSPNQPQETPKSAKSPIPNPSPNKPPEVQAPPTTPISPTPPNNANQPSGSETPSPSNPTPPPESKGGPDSSNTEQGGGVIAAIGGIQAIGNERDVLQLDAGDKLATCPSDSSSIPQNELKAMGITLDSTLELKAAVLVESNGQVSLLRVLPQDLPGNLRAEQVEQLAEKVLAQKRCEPTRMADQAVVRDYYLTLTIAPSQN